MGKRRVLCGLLALAGIVISASCQAKTVHSDKYGYSVNVPDDWQEVSRDQLPPSLASQAIRPGTDVDKYFMRKTSVEDANQYVMIVVIAYNAPQPTRKQLNAEARQMIDDYRKTGHVDGSPDDPNFKIHWELTWDADAVKGTMTGTFAINNVQTRIFGDLDFGHTEAVVPLYLSYWKSTEPDKSSGQSIADSMTFDASQQYVADPNDVPDDTPDGSDPSMRIVPASNFGHGTPFTVGFCVLAVAALAAVARSNGKKHS